MEPISAVIGQRQDDKVPNTESAEIEPTSVCRLITGCCFCVVTVYFPLNQTLLTCSLITVPL